MYSSENIPQANIEIPSRTPANYTSDLPIQFGAIVGIIGSMTIMAVIAALTLGSGESIWVAPRTVASALLGSGAASGIFPIILGTIMHLSAGAIYGAIFAAIMPRMPRPFWMVAGILFGVATWVIALIVMPIVTEPIDVGASAYFNVLLISHIVFGLDLGLAGSLNGLWKR